MRLPYLRQQIGVINILKNFLRECNCAHGLNRLEQLFHVVRVSLGYPASPRFASLSDYSLHIIYGRQKSGQGVRVCTIDLTEE